MRNASDWICIKNPGEHTCYKRDGSPYTIKEIDNKFVICHGDTEIDTYDSVATAIFRAELIIMENEETDEEPVGDDWIDKLPDFQKELVNEFCALAVEAFIDKDLAAFYGAKGALFMLFKIASIEQGVDNEELDRCLAATMLTINEAIAEFNEESLRSESTLH